MIQTAKPSARKGVIRKLREAKGWSQQTLADEAIVSFKTISSLEQGKRAQLSTFKKVAEALGVTPTDLIEQEEQLQAANTQPTSQPDKRVQITLTLSIPFQDFDETEGIDRLGAFLMQMISSKNAMLVTNVTPSSVKLTILVDEEDAPRLVQAFAAHKLDDIQAFELGVPRKVVLLLLTASVAQGIANPIVVPVLPFLAFMLVLRGLRTKGLQVANADDGMILLRWPDNASTSSSESTSILASFTPAEIQGAVEAVTPEELLPSFPMSINIRLEPDAPDGETAPVLGARLESQLASQLSPDSSIARVDAGRAWPGKLAITLATVRDLRALTEVILVHFLGKSIRLSVDQKRSGTFLGSVFSMDGTFTVSLSANTWESMAKELADVTTLPK